MTWNPTHDALVHRAGQWLAKTCPVVLTELVSGRETADAIGWHGGRWSKLVEVKVSRSDFLKDRKKPFRRHPHLGMGRERYYFVPAKLVDPSEVPEHWGLVWCYPKIQRVVKKAEPFPPDEYSMREELGTLVSAVRRLGCVAIDSGLQGVSLRVKAYNSETRNTAALMVAEPSRRPRAGLKRRTLTPGMEQGPDPSQGS